MPQIAVQEIITSITDVQGGINGGEVDDIGDVIHFQVLVTNPGDTALSGVTVNSSLLGSLSAPTGDTNNNGLLDLGETWTYTASYTVTGAEIVWNNHYTPDTLYGAYVLDSTFTSLVYMGIDPFGILVNTGDSYKTIALSQAAVLGILSVQYNVISADLTAETGDPNSQTVLHLTDSEVQAYLSGLSSLSELVHNSATISDTVTVSSTEAMPVSDGTSVVAFILDVPPTISSNGGDAAASVNVAENTTLVTTLLATQLYAHPLSWTITGGEDSNLFELRNGNELHFLAAPDFENLPPAGATAGYQVTVQVSDGNGGTDTQAITVTVTDVVENTVPVITSGGGGATASLNVDENSLAVTTVTAIDPDVGTTLAYSLVGGADQNKFQIDASTGALQFIAAPDFEHPTDIGHNNVYDVVVQVSDGNGGTDTQAITVTVTNVAEAITNGNGGGTLTGTSGDDVIDGQGGNDTINAGGGNDTIVGGPGHDHVNAGNGDDTVVATIGDGSFDVYSGGAGSDTIDMSGITAPAIINLAFGFVSSSQTGLDALVSIENVVGGSSNDLITGNDVNNFLDGQGGNDTINAGSGNDIIIGGAGNDTMNGGPGNDTFMFVPGFGNDRILGFDANPSGGQDLLDISAFGITEANFTARVTIADVGADTLITIDGNPAQTIRLVGIGDATTVTHGDFLL